MRKQFTIAIDGPVGSGKGTLGISLAKKLNALYFYTGGMYRALTLACLRKKIDLRDEEKVLEVLRTTDINLEISTSETKVFLGEELVNDQLFLPEVTNATPIIAAMPKVRKEMVRRQKKLVKGQNFIIEGRDIATDVAPYANLKIFLTADVRVRAKRRYKQLLERGIKKTFEEVLGNTKERDRQDSERAVSPLLPRKDAFVVDTTNDTAQETAERVMKKVKEQGLA